MTTESAGSGALQLPLFLPPPHSSSPSRRSGQRHNRAVAVTQSANSAVQSLNLLSTAFSDAASNLLFNHSNSQSTGARNQSIQNRMLAHVYRCATRFVRRRGTLVSESDDPLFDSKFLSQQLRQNDLDAYISRAKASVVPIIADRISLPSVPGSVDIVNLLPPKMVDTYSNPNEKLFRPPSDRPKAPKTRLCGEQSEWVKLVCRMAAAGMLDFTISPKVVCGVFAVPKDEANDRLIIDARPTNTWFVEPDAVSLPTPDLLARLSADPSVPLFVAKVDLDNFYHRLRLPHWMRP
jgi:hypothetical protein